MESAPASKPVRAWPVVLLAAGYWVFTLVVAMTDMVLFTRFMAGALSSLAFLVVFLILWSTNGTLPGRTRWLGVGLLFGGAGLGILLAHPTYDGFGFSLASVPWVLTGVAVWLILARRWTPQVARVVLTAVFLVGFGAFDLVRWEGLDGGLRSSASWRWSPSAEQAFLANKVGVAAAAPAAKSWTLQPGDMPEFRGALRDGVARGIRIETNWKQAPPQLVWKHRVGPGWGGVIAVDGHLVTQEQRGETEATVCYDAETGKEVWAHGDGVRFDEGISGPGPRATPTYFDGRLYTLGATGLVSCLDAATGKGLWARDLGKEGAAPPPQWGNSASPLVADGKVLVFVGGAGARGVVALDAATGSPVWQKLGGKESYSSVQLLTIGGKPQLLAQDNKSTAGLAVAGGELLWERPWDSSIIPMLQACPAGEGRVVVASGPGIALLDLKEEGGKWRAAETWTSERLQPSLSNFVVHDGYVYGFDNRVLACVSLKDGKRVWKKGRYGSGQLVLLADQGLLVVLSETGELALIEAHPQEPGEEFRFQAIQGKTWNHPTVAQDRLIVRNASEMACYRLRLLKSP